MNKLILDEIPSADQTQLSSKNFFSRLTEAINENNKKSLKELAKIVSRYALGQEF
jgi:hypothetical protein